MAINAPVKKPDAWDRLAQGLGIANQGLGIVNSVQGIRKSSADMAATEDTQNRVKQGIMTPKEQLEYSKDYNASETETPGSFGLKTPQGKDVYYSPKEKTAAKVDQTMSQKDAADLLNKDFKFVAAGKGTRDISVYGADGKSQVVGLVAPKFVDANAPLSEKDRLAKMNSTDKQRYDNVIVANDAIADMGKALGSGQSRYSLTGDNDYTAALGRFEEALGRMQSGGAIGDKEADRFRALARSLLDDPSMQVQKLQKLQGIMKDRYQTLGFDPSKNERFSYTIAPPKNPSASGLINEAQAGKQKLEKADIEALQWARNNSGDPRAKDIISHLKGKGL